MIIFENSDISNLKIVLAKISESYSVDERIKFLLEASAYINRGQKVNTPPAAAEAKPLTDDKVREIYGRDLMDYRDGDYMRFARAVEAAHGIVNIGAKE